MGVIGIRRSGKPGSRCGTRSRKPKDRVAKAESQIKAERAREIAGATRINLPANDWKPRAYQESAWNAMERGVKRMSLWWHRRAGKDEVALNRIACAAFERPGNYWYMLPEAAQARKIMWEAVNPATGKKRLDEIFPETITDDSRETDMFKRFKNGSTLQFLGSDNYKSLVGAPPVGIVFSEWARANPNAWGYLSPILAENDGWAYFITTPLGKNHAHRTHLSILDDQSAFAQTLTVKNTDVFSGDKLSSEKRRMVDIYGESLGNALFQQEYYCSAEAAIVGSIYGSEISGIKTNGRLGDIEAAHAPVHTAWDIGRSDATAIWWFQVVGNEVRILDYQEDTLKDLGYYSEQIKGRMIRTELAGWAYGHEPIDWGEEISTLAYRRQWAYGCHYLPHDAKHKTLAASGVSVEQILRKSLGNVQVVEATARGLDDAARTAVVAMLRKAWVDRRASEGLEILSNYRYRFDEEKRTMSRDPLHDFASHCADAARVMALASPSVSWQALAPSKPIKYPKLGIA